jgi:RND family efflux transporter MFP subunit
MALKKQFRVRTNAMQPPSRNWKWFLLLLPLAAAGAGAYAWNLRAVGSNSLEPQGAGSGGSAASASPVVFVIHPKKGESDRTTSQPGSIQAFESVELYAGVSGFLKTLNVDIGDRIKKGQALAQVDVPELEKQIQRNSSVVEQTRARVAQMHARAISTRADWDAARAAIPRAEAMLKSKSAELRYRQQQLQRMRELAASKSIEDKLVDEAVSHRDAVREAEIAAQESVTSAKANVAAMAAKIQAAEADVQEAEAQVRVAQADLEKTEVLVRFATVNAPFDGVVTQRNFFPSDFVRAANEGGAHIPLFTVQRTDLMRVVVQIPDRDVPFCDPGDPAILEIDALPGQQLKFKVSRIARSEDPETRLMRVELDLPNPTGKISNGMYGRVTIILDKSDLLSVPSSCLVGKSQDGKGRVFVVRNGKALLTPVEVGSDDGLNVSIIKGIVSTDEVILRPSSSLRDGTLVTATAASSTPKSKDEHSR